MSRFEQFYSEGSPSGPQVFGLPMRSSHLRIRLATTFNRGGALITFAGALRESRLGSGSSPRLHFDLRVQTENRTIAAKPATDEYLRISATIVMAPA